MTWFDKLLLVFVGCFGWSMAMGSYGLKAASEIIQKPVDAAKNKMAEIALIARVVADNEVSGIYPSRRPERVLV